MFIQKQGFIYFSVKCVAAIPIDLDSHVKERLGKQAWQLMTLIATNQGRSG